MANEQNWRTELDAETYFGHQKKTLAVADRRPVIRKASDLVGPGISAAAVPITDYNDLLATYNGYYSAVAGTTNAPTGAEAYVGITIMDSTFGGVQKFTGMSTGNEFKRLFHRNPSDPEFIFWDAWAAAGGGGGGGGAPGGWNMMAIGPTIGFNASYGLPRIRMDNGLDVVRLAGVLTLPANMPTFTHIFTAPPGFYREIGNPNGSAVMLPLLTEKGVIRAFIDNTGFCYSFVAGPTTSTAMPLDSTTYPI